MKDEVPAIHPHRLVHARILAKGDLVWDFCELPARLNRTYLMEGNGEIEGAKHEKPANAKLIIYGTLESVE